MRLDKTPAPLRSCLSGIFCQSAIAAALLSAPLASLGQSRVPESAKAWQPSAGHQQIALWPGQPPDPQPVAGTETVETVEKPLVAGRPWTAVKNVTRPTMTVYSPATKNTGAAVMVFPGGGYQILAIDLEGTEVCDWLSRRGITCILLKYRVTDVGPYPKSGPYPESPMALADAQRAIGLTRMHAAQWHIDPKKIGVLGFSAGGHLVAAVSTHFDRRVYAPADAADRVSCRPDFAIAIYPGHLSLSAAAWDARQGAKPFMLPPAPHPLGELTLNPELPVTHATPPTFLLQNEDDSVDNVDDALAYYVALKNAGVPAEMHLYAQGGHAFGLRPTFLPATHWPALVDTWLQTIGVTPKASPAAGLP
jgi:acetyl esterase/lipase